MNRLFPIFDGCRLFLALLLLPLGLLLAGCDHPGGIRYQLPQAGNVSAAVYDAEGRLVRELLHAAPQAAGRHTLIWDGLDRDGNALPAGDYTWKLLQTPGLKATYLMSLGSSFPPGDDWRTACGPGTHKSPFGIAVDESGIYVSAHTTENIETCMLKMTPDGTSRLWTALHPRPWDGALSLAVDGGEIFMLGNHMFIEGRIAPAQRRKQLLYVYEAATGQLAKRTVVGTAVGAYPVMIDVQWDPATDDMDASDMDAQAGVLVVAYEKRNALRWYDPQKGALLETAEVPTPAGVAVGADGTVFVSTGDRIVKLSQANKTPTDVVTGLDKPGRLDVDHTSGDLLVYEAGTQQIKRFSGAGALLKTYGAKGGRQDGLYDDAAKRSFAGFADLCADGKGGFYVTEHDAAPRRTAHFAADGSVVREWYGGQRWAPHAAPEGDNPNVMWVGSRSGWVMRVLVDYERKSWTVHSCYRYAGYAADDRGRAGLADGLVRDSWNEGGYFRVYKHGGATYLAIETLPTILKVDEKSWKLLPATVCGMVGNAPQFMKDWAGKNVSYQWNDANGDGLPQKAEVAFYETGIANSWMPHTAADFSCFMATGDNKSRWVNRFAVTSWNDAGSPIYGTMPQGERFAAMPQRFDPNHFADARWSVFMGQDPTSGSLYAALNDWTRSWCDYDDSFMQKWSADGTAQWTVSQLGKGFAVPGEVRTHLRGIAGIAHGCVIAIDNDGGSNTQKLYGNLSYVWDADGLFAGGLMDATDLNGIDKHWYQLGGEFCHASVATLPDGDVLFFGNWENEMRVYRVSGWNGWQRQSGTVRIEKPAAAHTGQGLTATTFEDAGLTKPLGVAVAPGIDVSWSRKKPAPGGIRWTGMLLPEYGPAYKGPWSEQRDKESFDGAIHGVRDNTASVAFRFRGTSIRIVGKTGPNCGFADIALDGEPQPQFDCYSPEVKRDAVLFAKEGLPEGDHEVTVTVVGWHGKPRNKASSDSWVYVDKFVVDGKDYDDAGLPHTFTATADGTVTLLVNRSPVLEQKEAKPVLEEITGKPVKLLRRRTPIEVTYAAGHDGGGIKLEWSTPLQPRQPIPTACLYPVISF